MGRYAHSGEILKVFREAIPLSQNRLSIKTQLVDIAEKGISESVLSQIEHGKRLLSAKYLKLIAATEVFSVEQMEHLCIQAIVDWVFHEFGIVLLWVERESALTMVNTTFAQPCLVTKEGGARS